MKSILNQLKLNADGLSILVFVACLLLPGFYVGDTQRENLGLSLLLTGWLGLFAGHFAWLANPLFLIAILRQNRKPGQAAVFALIGFLVALEFLVHKRILIDGGGGTERITGVGWGYVLWLSSFLVFFSSALEKIEAKKLSLIWFIWRFQFFCWVFSISISFRLIRIGHYSKKENDASRSYAKLLGSSFMPSGRLPSWVYISTHRVVRITTKCTKERLLDRWAMACFHREALTQFH